VWGGGGWGSLKRAAAGGGAVGGQPEGGSPGLRAPRRYTRRTRAAGRLLLLVRSVRRRRDANDRALLLENGRRSLRGPEAPDLIGDAPQYSHRRRSRRDSVRNHHCDLIRRDRGGRR